MPFKIYVDDLITELIQNRLAYAYVDDIVILSENN
jgi:hypothetical protein